MEKLRRMRGYILGMAIGVLILPTYTVLAQPMTAQTVPDFSWAADLPPIALVMIGIVVIIALLTWFFSKVIFQQQNKVTLVTPDGQLNKSVSFNEAISTTFSETLRFMRETTAQNQAILTQFNEQNREIMTDVNRHTEMIVETLRAFKDELIQGRGNQITAIMEVRDQFSGAVQKMEDSRTNIAEKIERLNGGVGYLQLGQNKMQKDLETLLEETKKLTRAIAEIVARIEHIDQAVGSVNEAELSVKSELAQLTTLVHSLDDRLNKISLAARTQENVGSPFKPELPLLDNHTKPDAPAVQEKDKSDVK